MLVFFSLLWPKINNIKKERDILLMVQYIVMEMAKHSRQLEQWRPQEGDRSPCSRQETEKGSLGKSQGELHPQGHSFGEFLPSGRHQLSLLPPPKRVLTL